MSANLSFDTLFAPQSIVVIGNYTDNFYTGEPVLHNLTSTGFAGKLYAITPREETLAKLPKNHGVITLSQITALAEEEVLPDIAYICCAATDTLKALKELEQVGVTTAIIASPGFSDYGREGAQLEEDITNFAKAHNITILGPNSLGITQPEKNLFLSDSKDLPPAGSIGFFSQSRSFFSEFINWSNYNNFGISTAVSLGNKAMLTEADILQYLGDDPNTAVIAGYIEEIEDGQRFLDVAHSVTRKKPVILIRSGRTATGTRNAGTSNYSPGTDIAYEAAFRQTGIIRVNSVAELFVTTAVFASKRLPKGAGVGILTNSGASSVIVADVIENTSLSLASLGIQTIEQLSAIMPSYASLYNPVDLTDTADEELFAEATKIVLQDPSVHSLFITVTKTYAIDIEKYCASLIDIAQSTDKPIVICLAMTEQHIEYVKALREAGITCLPYPEIAIKSVERLYKYAQWLDGPYPVEVFYRRDLGRAQNILQEAFSSKQHELSNYQSYDLLRAYEMPVLETKLARTSNDAVQIAKQIGYPVVLKLASPHIVNKAGIHGVKLGLHTPDEVRKAFLEITTKAMQVRKDAYIAGCLVQALAPINSHELTIGFKRDPSFGAIVYFGLSGRQTTSYRDFSCRVAPLSLHDAPAMVKEIKSFPLLAGILNEFPIKFTAIEDIILILSTIAMDFPEIKEISCDPVLANNSGAHVTGAHIILDETMAHKTKKRVQSVL